MPETVLYDYWRSSAAYRVRIGLHLLGLPFRAVPVDLTAGQQRGPDNLARNPQGLVPVLEIDGLRLTQSLAILEYLDETRGAGWLPGDAAARAEVRAMAHAVAMDTHPVCNLRVAQHAVSLGATMEGWMRHFIPLGLAGLEGLMQRHAGGRFSHGDGVTLADLCLLPQIYNARRWGVDLAPFPRVAEVAAALEALPAFQAAHPDRARPTP
ncbi:maleylacetoacetate isomerase [Rhodobacter calidifons]|uniref:Maleylacetoacetate isomerase n=1 Tax=Rhodobacter calidifons TaxID=2715277 RepID=A0ABX0G635_9RHOB|nr:maleylacetoacetate isomerase [Rhodobacter calidifons]NHB76304.1 maleylacetoacetate isomerase [Rhodobacter calidifons]